MKTIVTGGAGFIGSHLVDLLLQSGHNVTAIDNFSNGQLANLDLAQSHPNFTLCQANVADLSAIESAFSGAQWVFHLASLADIVPSIRDPLKYHQSNVDGTISVLEASRQAGVSRFIYTASSSCYGLPDEFPTAETAEIRPMYPYALTKNIGEQYAMHWADLYKLPCVSLRLFNVYGPRSRTSGTYGAVFGVFLAQKLANKPYTIVGDGTQTRDFVFVSDVAEAFIKAAESNLERMALNVGTGNPQSINHLVELLGGTAGVSYIPKRPGEPDCTQADVSLINSLLGWSAKMSFEEGVSVMLANAERWAEAPVWDEISIDEETKDWFKYLS